MPESANTKRTAQINIETDGEDENSFDWSVLMNFFRNAAGKTAGAAAGVLGSFRKVAPLATAAWKLTIKVFGTLASYCVIHWKEDEEETEENAVKSEAILSPLNKNDCDTGTSLSLLPAPASSLFYRWTIKATAASVATAAVLAGSYGGYKAFFPAAPVAVLSGTNTEDAAAQQPPEAAPTKDAVEQQSAPQPAVPALPIADLAKAEPKIESKTEPKAVADIPVKKESASIDDPFAAALAVSVPAAEQIPNGLWETPAAPQPQDKSKTETKIADVKAADSIDNLLDKLSDKPAEKLVNEQQAADKVQSKTKTGRQKDTPNLQKLKALEPLNTETASAKRSAKNSELAPLQAMPPTAAVSSVYDKTASNYAGHSEDNFAAKPKAPEKTQPIAAKKSEGVRPPAVAAPLKEITPKIPESGTIVAVKPQPKMTQPKPAAAANEVAPVIPKDSAQAAVSNLNSDLTAKKPEKVPNPVPSAEIAAAPKAAESPLTKPLGTQLKEQVQELRTNETMQPAELSLRFTPKEAKAAAPQAAPAAQEPALRFTPRKKTEKNTAAVSVEAAQPLEMKSLEGLLPGKETAETEKTGTVPAMDSLPPLRDAPQAVYVSANPAYRRAEVSPLRLEPAVSETKLFSEEGGKTFKKRMKELIQRSPESTEQYTVQQGDTYLTISDRFYGTSLLYTALAVHNRKLNAGWQPAEGAVIEVPPAEFLQAEYANVINRQERRLNAQTASQGIRYVVQDGDTLLGLAMDKLHNSARWHEILAMNTDRLSDPRDLKPGMEILIPAESVSQNRTNRR
ncbi:MAG: LysM peptidoglycan-binding domain-containing protein [Planctomycetaceae bacterium]|nr:LysM peptidoglycan-binding domain-containing protein [Planctomycetaceae bacterium]